MQTVGYDGWQFPAEVAVAAVVVEAAAKVAEAEVAVAVGRRRWGRWGRRRYGGLQHGLAT